VNLLADAGANVTDTHNYNAFGNITNQTAPTDLPP